MNIMLVTTIVLWVFTFKLFGFNLLTILSLISTGLFCGRKFAYFCKVSTLVTLESVGMFIAVVTKLLLHRFKLVVFLIVLLLRLIFFIIVYYETTTYTYVQKEEKREDNN